MGTTLLQFSICWPPTLAGTAFNRDINFVTRPAFLSVFTIFTVSFLQAIQLEEEDAPQHRTQVFEEIAQNIFHRFYVAVRPSTPAERNVYLGVCL